MSLHPWSDSRPAIDVLRSPSFRLPLTFPILPLLKSKDQSFHHSPPIGSPFLQPSLTSLLLLTLGFESWFQPHLSYHPSCFSPHAGLLILYIYLLRLYINLSVQRLASPLQLCVLQTFTPILVLESYAPQCLLVINCVFICVLRPVQQVFISLKPNYFRLHSLLISTYLSQYLFQKLIFIAFLFQLSDFRFIHLSFKELQLFVDSLYLYLLIVTFVLLVVELIHSKTSFLLLLD